MKRHEIDGITNMTNGSYIINIAIKPRLMGISPELSPILVKAAVSFQDIGLVDAPFQMGVVNPIAPL